MYVFFRVGSDTIPTRIGYDSPMKNNPGESQENYVTDQSH